MTATSPAADGMPDIPSLLHYVAFIVSEGAGHNRPSRSGLRSRPSGWLKRRGGYLQDELQDVQAASIRLQVSACARLCRSRHAQERICACHKGCHACAC